MEASDIRAQMRVDFLSSAARLIPFSLMRFIHPAFVLAHPVFQFPGQIVTDAPGGTLFGRHLAPDLADVGTVSADNLGQFGG